MVDIAYLREWPTNVSSLGHATLIAAQHNFVLYFVNHNRDLPGLDLPVALSHKLQYNLDNQGWQHSMSITLYHGLGILY